MSCSPQTSPKPFLNSIWRPQPQNVHADPLYIQHTHRFHIDVDTERGCDARHADPFLLIRIFIGRAGGDGEGDDVPGVGVCVTEKVPRLCVSEGVACCRWWEDFCSRPCTANHAASGCCERQCACGNLSGAHKVEVTFQSIFQEMTLCTQWQKITWTQCMLLEGSSIVCENQRSLHRKGSHIFCEQRCGSVEHYTSAHTNACTHLPTYSSCTQSEEGSEGGREEREHIAF